VARFAVSRQVSLWLGAALPWGTLAVNVLGSFLLGFLAAWFRSRTELPPEWQALWTVGFLGAFTTFSTFSNEVVGLLQADASLRALATIAANVLLCLCCCWGGVWLARSFGAALNAAA
jgi:CrcB protein